MDDEGSKIIGESLGLLRDDNAQAVESWKSGGPMLSFPQRSGKTIDELRDMFDVRTLEAEWERAYNIGTGSTDSVVKRRRIAFARASLKEFSEEFDPDVTDVDFMRVLSVPFTESKYVIDYSIYELGGK